MRTEPGGGLRTSICMALATVSLSVVGGCRGSATSSGAPPLAPTTAAPRSSAYLVGDAGGAPVQPPPPPDPEASVEGRNIGEMLGFVEGEYITRGSITRSLGPREPTQDEQDYEASIHKRLKDRAQQRVFVHAAELMGLQVPPDYLDKIAAEDLKKKVEEASQRLSRPVTRAQILAQKGQTLEEYRHEISDTVLVIN